ncbi:hypothetical protein QFZ64_006686 [Streptomyces sp. B3I8]|nr:hypothetical protein [Streptomyces sp. B3I8]MDQ0791189.1 hypothetical protein [Streptomyces sp. B3I8]
MSAVAEILEISEAGAHQLVSRARRHLAAERRKQASPAEHRRLLEVFLNATRTGDVAALEQVLTADVVHCSDGGGIRNAARVPVGGRTRVAKVLVAFAPRFWDDVEVRWVEANGRPAVLVPSGGTATALLSADVSAGGIDRLMRMLNPEKLAPFVASLDG